RACAARWQSGTGRRRVARSRNARRAGSRRRSSNGAEPEWSTGEGARVGRFMSPATEPFYAQPQGEARAFTEQALLAQEYPGFVMDVDDDGTPYAHGWIGPGGYLRRGYHVLILMPPGYGNGVPPRAYVLEPELRPNAPHRFSDLSLCLDHSNAFTRKSTIVTFLAWVSVWLHLYEDWLETGVSW